jgi:hypothetical protein
MDFFPAKNGAQNCSADGIRLHSAYDPAREAARFIERALDGAEFPPALIVVTEPALSYAADAVRERLDGCVICAVRYCREFRATDSKWDAVLYADEYGTPGRLAESLYARFGEDLLCAALFLPWEASERAFPQESKLAWDGIRTAVLKARDVLATREFFAERWLKNIVRFCLSLDTGALLRQDSAPQKSRARDFPAVIAASGPSLEQSIPYLANLRKRFFLIAASSALAPLASRGISPDLCITTDGGFWAKELLSSYPGAVAATAESALPARLFRTNAILPLSYNENAVEDAIVKRLDIHALSVRRNGTVSGTALSLARAISDGPVFFCGLDLGVSTGYQHARPHAREMRERTADTRVSPLSARQAVSGFNAKGQLDIYRNWFSAQSFFADAPQAPVFRIVPAPRESVGLRDILPEEFARICPVPDSPVPSFAASPQGDAPDVRAQKLKEIIAGDIGRVKNGNAPEVFAFREVFPARSVRRIGGDSLVSDYIERMENLLSFAQTLQKSR